MVKNYKDEYIKWMQLSDLHIGSKDSMWLDNTLRTKLQNFFEEENIKINFIVITGDIIHQGQFDNQDYCKKMNQFFELLLSFCEKIVVCPGNHDYKRNEARYTLLKQWKEREDEIKIKEQEEYAQKLRGDFDIFENVCKSIGIKDKVVYAKRATVFRDVNGINVIALNTSTFSGQPKIDEQGNIVLGKKDEPEIDDWGQMWISANELPDISEIAQDSPTIIVGHHPLDMFAEPVKKEMVTFIEACGIKYYFCGHVHNEENSIFDGIIEERAVAGLFKDDYNRPMFSIHKFKKSANETIITDRYYFLEGNWEKFNEKNNNNLEQELNSLEKKASGSEKEIEKTIDEDIFYIKPSELSDGAMRLLLDKFTFNIYTSVGTPSDITVPHKHSDIDEVTYVAQGKVFAYIDEQMMEVKKGDAVKMPKGKFHGFLPAEYPCEYLTMGVENGKNSSYETKWNEDINKINLIDAKLDSTECELEDYKLIIDYLKSSIFEVRWQAKNLLNKRLVRKDGADNKFIRDAVGAEVRLALRSKKIDKQFFGISVAYDLAIDIESVDIIKLLNNDENFMLAWVCAYYLIKHKHSINLLDIYEKNCTGTDIRFITDKHLKAVKYYERTIIAILQLLIKHDGSLLKSNYSDLQNMQKSTKSMRIEDIIVHFVMWHTSFTFANEELDFANASKAFNSIFNDEGEQILRGITNIQDYNERFLKIRRCEETGKLLDVVIAYFENRSEIKVQTEEYDKIIKDRIKNYLRIIVSENCNLNCVYCHHEGRVGSLIGSEVKDNPQFNLKMLLEKAKKMNFTKIKISGGEPLLYPNILQICHEFQNDFVDIGFTSNGTMINDLVKDFEKIRNSKLTFNITLNALDPNKYKEITGKDSLNSVKEGIEYLVESGFNVKINAVITSFNIDEIVNLISYAARLKINIKLLDLFTVDDIPNSFKHVSIPEIKNRIIKLFRLEESDFRRINDYLVANVMGIEVMIPSRVYSADCQHNCQMYPCAEGIFGIRVYEDYSCAKCFVGPIYQGGIEQFELNINKIRKELGSFRFSY